VQHALSSKQHKIQDQINHCRIQKTLVTPDTNSTITNDCNLQIACTGTYDSIVSFSTISTESNLLLEFWSWLLQLKKTKIWTCVEHTMLLFVDIQLQHYLNQLQKSQSLGTGSTTTARKKKCNIVHFPHSLITVWIVHIM